MCEIAVINPEKMGVEITHQLLAKFHEEQGDGVGIVAVHNQGDRFEYDTYKSTTPHWQTFFSFLQRNYSRDSLWRVVLHGRAKTTGAVNRKTAHPIEVNCDECEFDYVVHNGHVKKHSQRRGSLTTGGHTFETEVDTEIIAHTIGELPDDVSSHTRGTYDLTGNLNYLVFSEDGILIRSGSKYHLSEDITMTCSWRDFQAPEALGFDKGRRNRWALVHPGEDGPEIEVQESVVRSGTSAYRGNGYNQQAITQDSREQAGSWGGYAKQRSATEMGQARKWTDEKTTIEYEDHSKFDSISALKVAPGTIHLIDHEAEEENFITEEEEPRLYYWYLPDERVENPLEDEQASLTEIIDKHREIDDGEYVGEAIYEEVATTVASNVDEITVAEMADIKEDVIDATFAGAEAAEAASQIETTEIREAE